MLKDGRADREPVDPTVIMRSNFLVKYYEQRGSPKRIPMGDVQVAWRKRLIKRFADEAMVKKYELSDDQIRRIIKKYRIK